MINQISIKAITKDLEKYFIRCPQCTGELAKLYEGNCERCCNETLRDAIEIAKRVEK